MIYLTGKEFVPLLRNEEATSDDDTSSAESLELATNTPQAKVDAQKPKSVVDNDDNEFDVFHSIGKFVDDELEQKLHLDDHPKDSNFGKQSDDEEHHFSIDIWNKPTEAYPQPQSAKLGSSSNISYTQGPPGLSKEKPSDQNIHEEKQSRRKNHDSMRMMYQKTTARSDEQAFNIHMRQKPMLPADGSLIEEENKSSSNLNLSTSSRSYKPGFNKSRSTAFGPEVNSGTKLPPTHFGHFPGNMSQTSGQPMYQQPNQNMMMQPSPMMGFPKPPMDPIKQQFPQYPYPMNVPTQPGMFPSKPPGYTPPMMKHSHGSLGNVMPADKPGEVTREEPVAKLVVPTTHTMTASTSNLTSGSNSPPMTEMRFGTGLLKFFNQQHQYGFMISDKDGSDIFFHYDDVKHTLLSKEFLRHATEIYDVRFSFQILDYVGKYESSKKAVNINLLSIIAKNTDI